MARFRKTPNSPRALTAAATRLPHADADALRKSYRPPKDWQNEAWEFFDTVPELKFTATWAGNQLAKVKLYVATLVPGSDDPVAVENEGSGIPDSVAATLNGLLADLRGDIGGQADVQRVLTENLDVAGECYLIGRAPTTVTPRWQWEVRSISEVFLGPDGKLKVRRSPDDREGVELAADDVPIRCFVRHPRWAGEADTNVKALFTELRSLQVLSAQVMAESMSRANAGLLKVPNGLTSGKAGEDAAPESDGDSEQNDPFMVDLTAALTRPIADPGDPSSVVPMLVRGEREDLMALEHVDLSRDTSEQLDKRIESRVLRVARGLNAPVEVVLGHQATTFANAAQVDADVFTDHLEPRVLLQCDLLTAGYLRPQAPAECAPYLDRVFVWYDASDLQDPPDQSKAADEAFDRGQLGFGAYLEAKGFTAEQAPTPEERLLSLLFRQGSSSLSPELTGAILRKIPGFTPPEPAAAPAVDPGQQQAAAHLLAAAARQAGMTQAMLSLMGLNLPIGEVFDTSATEDSPGNPQLPRG